MRFESPSGLLCYDYGGGVNGVRVCRGAENLDLEAFCCVLYVDLGVLVGNTFLGNVVGELSMHFQAIGIEPLA